MCAIECSGAYKRYSRAPQAGSLVHGGRGVRSEHAGEERQQMAGQRLPFRRRHGALQNFPKGLSLSLSLSLSVSVSVSVSVPDRCLPLSCPAPVYLHELCCTQWLCLCPSFMVCEDNRQACHISSCKSELCLLLCLFLCSAVASALAGLLNSLGN